MSTGEKAVCKPAALTTVPATVTKVNAEFYFLLPSSPFLTLNDVGYFH